jgi:hypothetical protein
VYHAGPLGVGLEFGQRVRAVSAAQNILIVYIRIYAVNGQVGVAPAQRQNTVSVTAAYLHDDATFGAGGQPFLYLVPV